MISLLLEAGGCKTGMCVGLNTSRAFENARFLTTSHLLRNAYATHPQPIQGADGSQCVWDKRPCALSCLTGNWAHWHAGSASFPIQESKHHGGASWVAVGSRAMMAICSFHLNFFSILSALEQVNVRLTVNTSNSHGTHLEIDKYRCWRTMEKAVVSTVHNKLKAFFITD